MSNKLLAASAGNIASIPTVDVNEVFSIDLYTGNSSTRNIVNGVDLATDRGLVFLKSRTSNVKPPYFFDTERGVNQALVTSGQDAEFTYANSLTSFNSDGISLGSATNVNESTHDFVAYTFKKAEGFFDCFTYVGDGDDNREVLHSLGVMPELAITKPYEYNNQRLWTTSSHLSNHTGFLELDSSNAHALAGSAYRAFSTSGMTFPNGSGLQNALNWKYVVYLFASILGVSKVGTYTGNGTSQTIDCDFSTGAQLVLIKRTDSTGDWVLADSSRGIVAGNDPYLKVNDDTQELVSNDSVDPESTGFIVNQNATTNLNINSANYLFLAIAEPL